MDIYKEKPCEFREATEAEKALMSGWVAWAYEKGLAVAFYPEDNVVIRLPQTPSDKYMILQRGAPMYRRGIL